MHFIRLGCVKHFKNIDPLKAGNQNYVKLPVVKPMVFACFRQFEKKMAKEVTHEMVNKMFQKYLDADFLVAQPYADPERENKTCETWDLPIFTVTNPNKLNQIGLVWDATVIV